ncbi:toll-like receptor Tollo isoform X2 [Hyposmocoma kahamanoa]|uniref:toll-like receptor Tollo isoform X2 n=1 Tax=Hyposmocoma kahamanoa TaxID=1477025 RepID=UPI000E6D8A12|nr:toll-like receptor Tollo isoform X2 [Hyposmocoma kahamanoa]
MCSKWLASTLLVLSAALSAWTASLSATTGTRYQAPDECRWTTDDDGSGVALQCRLRTINSELENTNFSAIQPHLTVRLRLECSDALFFQSSLAPGSFRQLIELRELTIEYCKIGNLSDGAFTGLRELRNLTIRTHNTDWSTMSLEITPTAFSRDVQSLERLDLSENNMLTFPEGALCTLRNLEHLNMTGNRMRDISHFQFSSAHRHPTEKCGDNLLVLDLSRNVIDTLPPSLLSGLKRLQKLYLQGNGLNSVADRALEGLISLTTIRFSDNQLTSLPPELFSDTKELKEIYLNNNTITVLAPGLFSDLVQLLVLDLSHNELTSDWINTSTFSGLKRLVFLDFSHNRVSKMEIALFRDLHNLQILKVQDNYIEHIPENVFSSLANLHTLILSNNRLINIESYAFTGLQVLSVLSIDSNRITKIHPHALRNCSSLQDLHINGNRLDEVPVALKEIPQLKTLDLGENLIVSIENASFMTMQKINTGNRARTQPKLMDLDSIYCKLLYNRGNSYVPLVEAASHQFLCKYEFHCFALCHCCDFDACDCEMTCPNNCTCYHDQSWSANVVECSNAGYVNTLPERIPMEATQLYLDGNDIKMLPSHAFIGRKRLKILYLNSSNIEAIHNRTFNGLKELEILHLDYNELTTIEGQEFDGLDNLHEFYINNNKIRHIGKGMFNHMSRLKVLHLHHNRLTTLSVWQINPAITAITLSYNPWSCDCEYTEMFREWTKRVNSITDLSNIKCIYTKGNNSEITTYNESVYSDPDSGFNIVYENGSTCTGLPSINNSINGNLTATKTIITNEEVQDYIPLLVATLGAFLLVSFVSMIVFIFRQEMRVWFHSKFGVRLFYRASDIDRDDREKMFDAFVSYSSKDEAWVAEELAPMLERGDPSYKLCLHYRDFPVGGYVADNIIQAVESSRRTIMVLSENFIKSEWCRFEFKSAHHQVLRDRRRRLIVVLLGEVPQKDLDPDIRLYLKTNTYLHWGDKLFWEKLRFALPDVPNNQRCRGVPSPGPGGGVPMHRHHHTRNHLGALPAPPVHGALPVLPPHPAHAQHQGPPRASPRTLSVHV